MDAYDAITSNRLEVLKEFPPVGNYRVRIVRDSRDSHERIDIREYVSSDTFEGFTHRGIMLGEREEIRLLHGILAEVLANADLRAER